MIGSVRNLLRQGTRRVLELVSKRLGTRVSAAPPPGQWVQGSHRESAGRLILAPIVAPHRPYWLHLPAKHTVSEQLPLIVMLHGCRQDANSFAAGTRMNTLADRERFLVLYPEQRRLANPHRCWNWFDPSSQNGSGEAAIVAQMVRSIISEYNADGSRIYVAGLSSGGALASILASCYADMFAACAVHSGVMFQAADSIAGAERAMHQGSEFDPLKAGEEAFRISGHKVDAMPVIVIHGTQDDRVNASNADQVVAQFLRMNQLTQNDTTSHPKIEERTASCADGRRYGVRDFRLAHRSLIRQVMIEELAHAWSGGDAQYLYNDPKGPDATTLIWDFFKLHRRLPLLHPGARAATLINPRASTAVAEGR